MARCKTDMLSGLIRKSPPASAGALRAGRLAPLFPPGQAPPQRGFCPGRRLYGPAAKEGDNNFLLWQRENKGDFVNCRSSNNSNTSPLPPGEGKIYFLRIQHKWWSRKKSASPFDRLRVNPAKRGITYWYSVRAELVEAWTTGGIWLFTNSTQMIKQRFLDFFRNLKKLWRNSILDNKGKFEVFPSVTLWWGESVLVK